VSNITGVFDSGLFRKLVVNDRIRTVLFDMGIFDIDESLDFVGMDTLLMNSSLFEKYLYL